MMSNDWRLASFRADGDTRAVAGVIVNGRIHYASDLLGGQELSAMDLLQDWDNTCRRLDNMAAPDGGGMAVADAVLDAPVLYPGTFYCAGANYWDHLEEMGDFVKKMTGSAPSMEKGAEPWLFIKTSAPSIIGHGADVHLPIFSDQVDWEAELGVVIGKRTTNISEGDALGAVAGYLIVNDLSARDYIKRENNPFIYDWIGQKCFTDAAPMRPWLTPASRISDPGNLSISLSVNGVVKQDSNTSQMVHSIEEQIAYLSRHITLMPGDVIATGTPAGVGMPKGEFLRPGDEVAVTIEGLGTLSNRCVQTEKA